jgi:hypothetical protein
MFDSIQKISSERMDKLVFDIAEKLDGLPMNIAEHVLSNVSMLLLNAHSVSIAAIQSMRDALEYHSASSSEA